MIYAHEGHTYTAEAMQKKLRHEFRDRGLRTWATVSLDEMIKHTDEYGITEVTTLRKPRWKADRHITTMVVPHEAQLLKLWELDVPLENCIFNNDKLIAFFQLGFRMIKYVIDKDGSVSTVVFDMARGERKEIRKNDV